MKLERIDKILCGTGLYTRSEARSAIASGAVTVDDAPVRRPEEKVSRASEICAAGQLLDTAEFVYLMMNKPAGYVSGARDEGDYPAVTGLLPREYQNRGVFCVGRLDADVTGLLLLTDDGAYAHRVTAPRSGVPKTYEVRLDGTLTAEDTAALAAGAVLRDGTAYRPAETKPCGDDLCLWLVTVTEGKYHEVKNLMAFCGRKVLAMRRLSIGALCLDEALGTGQFRRLTEAEAQMVFHKFV